MRTYLNEISNGVMEQYPLIGKCNTFLGTYSFVDICVASDHVLCHLSILSLFSSLSRSFYWWVSSFFGSEN